MKRKNPLIAKQYLDQIYDAYEQADTDKSFAFIDINMISNLCKSRSVRNRHDITVLIELEEINSSCHKCKYYDNQKAFSFLCFHFSHLRQILISLGKQNQKI